VAVATVTKLGAAYFMARRCGMDHPQSAMIGFMMNTRALMELIVLNVGLDLGVITPKLFTMLVIMAIVSTIITTPALRYFMPRAGLKLQA
jgi:Kef-type K+ transport system membrane component KefB